MKKTRVLLFIFLLFLLIPAVFLSASADQTVRDIFGPLRDESNLLISDGFGALKWGVSVEEAQKLYPDLREDNSKIYNQYTRGKKGPDGVRAHYLRKNENLKVGGHSADSIKYQFLEGNFYVVGISLSCDKESPCNIEEVFQDIVNAIRKIYGKPYEISSTTYEDDSTVKNAGGVVKYQGIEWKIEDESIIITKSVEPKMSFIVITIFSYEGYFSATGQER